MNATAPPIVICPVCGSTGVMLHHDIRASLDYSCLKCLHEWQIDPAAEPADPATSREPPPGSADSLDRADAPDPIEAVQQGSPSPPAPFRRIAVCVDGSEMGETLVRHASMIAAAFGVPLTILRVLEPDSHADAIPEDPLDWDVRQREARADLDRLQSTARQGQGQFDVQTELLQGRAADQICCWGLQHGADLTVLASHGEHGRGEWALSSTARKLVDGVPGSLLLVPADGACEGGEVPYRRIMVPLDGSTRAESVLPIATRLATVHTAELLIAHVTPAPELTRVGPLTAQDLDLEDRVIARNERVARRYLDQIRARLAEAGVPPRTSLTRGGDARTRLVRLIRREGVDLVILSAYGRRGPRDAPCGSVAAHLLAHVAAPLLVFRERPRRVIERMSQDAAKRAGARSPAQAAP